MTGNSFLYRLAANPAYATIFLFLFTILVYANGADAFFVGDDYDLLRQTKRLDNLLEVFTESFFHAWVPATYTIWYMDYQLWDLTPNGYHWTNIYLTAITAVSIFALLRSLWPTSLVAAWSAAILFAVHPMHDEAVTYIAARGHLLGGALSVLVLLVYSRARIYSDTAVQKYFMLFLALSLAFLSGLAKESTMTLPAWIAVLEFGLVRKDRSLKKALAISATSAFAFAIPMAIIMVLRREFVGLDSKKIEGISGDFAELGESLVRYLPEYALTGGLPFPFGLMNSNSIDHAHPIGWLLVIAALIAGALALAICLMKYDRMQPAIGIFGLGFVIALVTLAILFWADLSIRRRYLYLPSIGIVLMASVVFHALYIRFKHSALIVLVLMVLTGVGSIIYKNQVYRESGEVARNLIETVRSAPLGEPANYQYRESPNRFVLVALPRMYGGDKMSGAYLFFRAANMKHALRLYGIKKARIEYAMKIFFAHDYHADAKVIDQENIDLALSFEGEDAYNYVRRRNKHKDRKGHTLRAELVSDHPESLELHYNLQVLKDIGPESMKKLLIYSDGRFKVLSVSDISR